jgi:hypothetical protein
MSPGTRIWPSPVRGITRPRPVWTTRSCPAGCMCQWVRAPTEEVHLHPFNAVLRWRPSPQPHLAGELLGIIGSFVGSFAGRSQFHRRPPPRRWHVENTVLDHPAVVSCLS